MIRSFCILSARFKGTILGSESLRSLKFLIAEDEANW